MCRIFFRCRKRITPAWAGKRSCAVPRSPACRDHPRVGGEKIYAHPGTKAGKGSPPRGRGKAKNTRRPGLSTRITPAWAGKSDLVRMPGGQLGDHPRVGGEKLFTKLKKTTGRDHPRVGGEKDLQAMFRHLLTGSPPRGRGKALILRVVNFGIGITPAWAGKSCRTWRATGGGRDHPRVGGEKRPQPWAKPVPKGSPPRGRGKDMDTLQTVHDARITPAWAGKSCGRAAPRAQKGDHPRVGGEKRQARTYTASCQGSPPRGRGKGGSDAGPRPHLGITPAWAGKRLKRSHRSGIFISGPIPFHSVLHRPAGSGGSRAGRDGSPAGQPQNAGPA